MRCKWCDNLAGRYEYGEEPEKIYRRHDNCGCVVTYENGRKRQDVWSKKSWETPETDKSEYKPEMLDYEQAKTVETENMRFKGVDKFDRNDIINTRERITKSSEYAVPKNLVSTKEFRNKFNSMSENPRVQREFYRSAKEILSHRSGNNGEDLYLYNSVKGKWYKSTTGKLKGEPDYTEEIYRGLKESKRGEIIAFHNHPNGMPPSEADLNAAMKNGYKKGYTIGHDGVIFEYTPTKYEIPSEAYALNVQKYKKQGLNEFDAQIAALNNMKDFYGFDFKEVK